MKIGVTINLGNFEFLKYESNDLTNDVECAKELIKKLSKHDHMEVELYIKAYLLPILEDTEIKLKKYIKKIKGVT